MSKAGINRSLPNNEYQAAVNANAPSAVNPFLTAGDLPSTTNRSTVVAFAAGMNTFVSAIQLVIKKLLTLSSQELIK